MWWQALIDAGKGSKTTYQPPAAGSWLILAGAVVAAVLILND